MRTTLDIDDAIVKNAKKRAAEQGETLTKLIEDALRLYLRHRPRGTKRFRLSLLTKRGRLVPGVNVDDRDSLDEGMEEADAAGNLVFDAQIAALCREAGVSRILTEDRGFDRFERLAIERL
jgi:predicted nucleic acid-binding protein